jgi:putative DNA primase/helicase
MDKRDFNAFRAEVSDKCAGYWEEWFSLYLNGDDVSTLFTRRNITCPECNGDKKFYLSDRVMGSGHCCVCKYHTYDGLMTISVLSGTRLGEVTKNIGSHLGLTDEKPKEVFIPQKPKIVKRTEMTDQEIDTLKRVLNSSRPMESGDVVWRYLVGRGLSPRLVNAVMKEGLILTNESVYHAPTDTHYACMVVPVKSPFGHIVGAHRTFLIEDELGHVSKIDHEHNKMLTGSFEDAYIGSRIELGGPAGDAIGIAEGIETALAVNAMHTHCWSVLNTAGMQSFIPPEGVKRVFVFADNDKSKAGQFAAYKCKERLTELGYVVKCYLPRPHSKDGNFEGKSFDWLDYYLQLEQCRKAC